jgi:hypothetical protein
MMFEEYIRQHPRYREAMSELTNSCRMYWRRNVGKYFDLRKAYWELPRKMDHRISISTGETKILANVLEVHWFPETGHVTIRPGILMVKGKGRYWNLVNLLAEGTRPSKGAYRVAIDARIKTGERPGTTGDQWTKWMNVFIPYVDKKINEMADTVAELTADVMTNHLTYCIENAETINLEEF